MTPRGRQRPQQGQRPGRAVRPRRTRPRRRRPGDRRHRPAAQLRGSTGSCCAGRRASTRRGPTASCPWALAGLLFIVYFVHRPGPGRPPRRRAATWPAPCQAAWQIGNFDVAGDHRRRRRQLLRRPSLPLGVRAHRAAHPAAAGRPARCSPPSRHPWPWASSRSGGWPDGPRTSASARPAALVVAYALHPAVLDLSLADFHPMTMALTPLLAAAYAAERRRWRQLAVFSVIAVALNAELGLVVAMLGLHPRPRGRAPGGDHHRGCSGWPGRSPRCSSSSTVSAAGFVAVGAFDAYGGQRPRGPHRDAAEPVPPARRPRRPGEHRGGGVDPGPAAVPPARGRPQARPGAAARRRCTSSRTCPVTGAGRRRRASCPILAFAFVAAPFGLARLGRRSLERVLVDHRILLLLVAAAVAASLTTSVVGPYGNGWARDREGREELRAILAAVPDDVRIRVPESIAAEAGRPVPRRGPRARRRRARHPHRRRRRPRRRRGRVRRARPLPAVPAAAAHRGAWLRAGRSGSEGLNLFVRR